MNASNIIVDVRKIESNSKLRGTAEVTIPVPELGELTFNMRILEGKSGLWVALPQESYVKNGETKYNEVLKLTKGFKKEIDEIILEKYRQLIAA